MKKNELKLVFMGTPKISAYVFEAMINEGYHFVGLVAQPDHPVGRKGIVEKVPTKVIAEKYHIPVFQPVKIRNDYSFIDEIKPDLVITLAYGQIVPQEFLDKIPLGCLNLHGSLLPKYRGASPVQTALINNEKITGVTLMEMVKAMDAGRMYAKKVVTIDENDNATSLFNKIKEAARELVIEALPLYINKELKGEEQDEKEVTFCSIIKPEQEKLDLSLSAESIVGWIRGLSDEPGAYLYLNNQKLKIYKAKKINDFVDHDIGEIVKADKNGLYFQTKDGQIAILELQKEGKKRMDYRSFINGNQNLLGQKLSQMEKSLRLSVHQLVDFLLRTGDIDNRVFNRSSMNEGTRLHASYQAKQSSNYMSEYPLQITMVVDEIEILLEGRADGIIKRGPNDYVIDEIKTTVEELNKFHDDNLSWHLGQAKCYAYMFAKANDLDYIGVKLTYIRQGKESEKFIDSYVFNILELEQFVIDLISEYLEFYNIIFQKNAKRDESIEKLAFPFKKYRPGQRELAKYCYAVTKKQKRLFVEAPTGIGKTISTIFPFIKAIREDEKTKIFYLTAKTSGKEAAHHAIKIMKENGLSLSDIIITAKDKICFCKGKACNPDECPYASHYYDKVQTVLRYAILNFDDFDLQTITRLAYENQICPFEFELDLSLFVDVIICDYNYLFDPISYMKRYFDEDASHYLALVDEAHNLIDRSRDMYSASLSYEMFKEARKSVRHSKLHKLKLALSKMNKMFKEYFDNEEEDGNHIVLLFYENTYKTISSFVTTMQDVNKNDNKEVTKELLDFYLEVNRFNKMLDFFNKNYLCFYVKSDDNVVLNLTCLDASIFLKECLRRLKGAVLFSATLSPIDYYVNTLGGSETDARLILPSPFPTDNLKIIITPNVSVRYKKREASYQKVADYIKSFVSQKVGNYFVFLPSYEYLSNLMPYIDLGDALIYEQNKDMTDEEKELFLGNFLPNPNKTTVGFVIVGGAFGEGIDLVSDRLIGAVIVGIGMPKINFVSDQIASYYDEKGVSGYDYAYINPGMNRVMQALGRVIRSETDRGAVLLIDERYLNNEYRDLFKAEWRDYEVAFSPKEVSDILQDFFKE